MSICLDREFVKWYDDERCDENGPFLVQRKRISPSYDGREYSSGNPDRGRKYV
jgi:hypothetical protein